LHWEPLLFGLPATFKEFAYRAPYQPGHWGAVAGRKLFKSGDLVTCQGDRNPVRKQTAFRSWHSLALQWRNSAAQNIIKQSKWPCPSQTKRLWRKAGLGVSRQGRGALSGFATSSVFLDEAASVALHLNPGIGPYSYQQCSGLQLHCFCA
jgi:hypothetical protein